MEGNPKPTSPNLTSVTFGDVGLGFPSGTGCVACFLSFFCNGIGPFVSQNNNNNNNNSPSSQWCEATCNYKAHLVSFWREEVEGMGGFFWNLMLPKLCAI